MNPEPFTYLRLYHDDMERTYRKSALVREARLARKASAIREDPNRTRDDLLRRVGGSVAGAFRVVVSALASQRQPGV